MHERMATPTDKHIFRDGQIGTQGNFLVDRADSVVLRLLRRLEVNRSSFNGYLAGVFFVYARHNLYKRGLACSVFTHKGMDFAFPQREVDVRQSLDPWKGLADSLHFKHLFRLQLETSFGFPRKLKKRCGKPHRMVRRAGN
jgi:hypothetical protein